MKLVDQSGTLKIFASRQDDIGEGFVWLGIPDLPPRCVVKITNPDQNRSVYCELLQIDANFQKIYNQNGRFKITDPESSLVIGEWYRTRLGGLKTQANYQLTISNADTWLGKLLACIDHPQIVVRAAIWLGILSVVLGGIGAVLGATGVVLSLTSASN